MSGICYEISGYLMPEVFNDFTGSVSQDVMSLKKREEKKSTGNEVSVGGDYPICESHSKHLMTKKYMTSSRLLCPGAIS